MQRLAVVVRIQVFVYEATRRSLSAKEQRLFFFCIEFVKCGRQL
jgi:hypothetical protein